MDMSDENRITGLPGRGLKLTEQLNIEVDRFRFVAKATADVIRDWEIETGTIFWGDSFQTKYGYQINEASKKLSFWQEHIHPEDHDRVMDAVYKVIDDLSLNYWDLQYRLRIAGNNYIHVVDKSYLIRDANGNALRAVGALHDNTEIVNYQKELIGLNEKLEQRAKELAHSNAELERYAYVASHDLQEPLRMVSGFLELLAKKYSAQLDATALNYINFAVDGAVRMKRLISDLLEYSQLGKGSLTTEVVDLSGVLKQVERVYRSDIQSLKVNISVGSLPKLVANRDQMLQLFQNLVGNAIKYRRPGIDPQIHVSAELIGQKYQFSVSDNGIGIDMKFANKIFIIFQRLHSKEQYPGTGIGLAICNKIVKQHHGDLWVNAGLDKGSTFYFTIPNNLESIKNEGN
jgi:signal transduction histidine kinase